MEYARKTFIAIKPIGSCTFRQFESACIKWLRFGMRARHVLLWEESCSLSYRGCCCFVHTHLCHQQRVLAMQFQCIESEVRKTVPEINKINVHAVVLCFTDITIVYIYMYSYETCLYILVNVVYNYSIKSCVLQRSVTRRNGQRGNITSRDDGEWWAVMSPSLLGERNWQIGSGDKWKYFMDLPRDAAGKLWQLREV